MPVRLCVGDPILIYIDKKTKTQAMGLIKYIGFIEGHNMTEFVGIELLEQHSKGHDGIINGYQYFTAKKNHGMHVRISNIIRKLDGGEIMLKLQEVISVFKKKLDQYIDAVDQRNTYIESLKQTHRNAMDSAKALLQRANDKIHHYKSEQAKYRPSSAHSSRSQSPFQMNGDDDNKQQQNNTNDTTTKQRRFSASKQMKLQTIDDSYALSTPVADVPLLIGQLVQSMDARRQSFNTAQSERTAPITPMTPPDRVDTSQNQKMFSFPDTKKQTSASSEEESDVYEMSPDTNFMSPSQSPRKHNKRKHHHKKPNLKNRQNVKSNISAATSTTTATDVTESAYSATDQETEEDETEDETVYTDSEAESQSTAYRKYTRHKSHKKSTKNRHKNGKKSRHVPQSSVESPRNGKRHNKTQNRSKRSNTHHTNGFYPSHLRKGKTVNMIHTNQQQHQPAPHHAHHNTAYYVPAMYPNKQQPQQAPPQLEHWIKQKQIVQNQSNPYLDQQYLPQYNNQNAMRQRQMHQQQQQQQQQRNMYMQQQQMQQQQQHRQRGVRGPKRYYNSDTLNHLNRTPNKLKCHPNMQLYQTSPNQQQHTW